MLSRSLVARSNTFSTRHVLVGRPVRVQARLQSTVPSPGRTPRSFDASHVAAGVAGGLTVVLAGYAWYHMSGLKNVVQSAKDMKSYFKTTRDRVLISANEAAKNPSEALSRLRSTAKSYTFFIPGVTSYVDDVFDELDYLYETHSDEMDSILKETADKLAGAARSRRPDAETARKVSAIVGNAIYRVQVLGGKAGNQFLDRHPFIKENLGSSYEQLQSVAQRAGFEGSKALREAIDQIKELAAKNKLDENSIMKVRESIQEKASRLRGRVGTYEMIGNFFDLKAPENMRERAEVAKNSARGAASGVLGRIKERGEKSRNNAEQTEDEPAK